MPKIRILLLIATLVLTCTTTAVAVRKKNVAVDGLLLSIAHDDSWTGPDRAARFIVTFRNLNDREMTVTSGTLSFGCKNGVETSETDQIKLNLIGSRGKRRRQLSFAGDGPPYTGVVCSSMAPFQVEIRPGASISFPLDLRKYLDLSDSKKYVQSRVPKGTYSLQAELDEVPSMTERSSAVKAWHGTVTSNTLRVRFGKEFASVN